MKSLKSGADFFNRQSTDMSSYVPKGMGFRKSFDFESGGPSAIQQKHKPVRPMSSKVYQMKFGLHNRVSICEPAHESATKPKVNKKRLVSAKPRTNNADMMKSLQQSTALGSTMLQTIRQGGNTGNTSGLKDNFVSNLGSLKGLNTNASRARQVIFSHDSTTNI